MHNSGSRTWLVVIVGVGLAAASAAAQDCPDQIGHLLGGRTDAVAVDGSHVIYNVGSGLRLADVSDPEAPRVVGQLELGAVPWVIEVADSYAYIIARGAGLRVVDVSTPSEPFEAGSLAVMSGWGDVAVRDGYAFVADEYHGELHVIAVSTPAHMAEVAQLELGLHCRQLALAGEHLFLSGEDDDGHGLLQILDVSSPLEPYVVASLGGDYSGDVVVDSSWLYQARSDSGGLRVVDISDLTRPVEVASLPDVLALGLEVFGDTLLAAAGSLAVIDVSTPAAPVVVGRTGVGDYWGAHDIAVGDDPAYDLVYVAAAAANGGGLSVVDVTRRDHPYEVTSLGALQNPTDVVLRGRWAYVADGQYPCDVLCPDPPAMGLRVVDVSLPEQPVEVGAVLPGMAVEAIAISGSHAIALTRHDGLRVLDLAVPSSPVDLGAAIDPFPPGALCRDIALAENRAYVAIEAAGGAVSLSVLDLGDPAAPRELGSWGDGSWAVGVAVEDNLVALATRSADSGGLSLVDVSNPSAPTEVGALALPIPGRLALAGGHAYVTTHDLGLVVVDVRLPQQPVLVGEWSGDDGLSVTIRGRYAFVTTRTELWVLDVSDPAAPLEVGRSGGQTSIAIAGALAATTDRQGLQILDLSCLLPGPHQSSGRVNR